VNFAVETFAVENALPAWFYAAGVTRSTVPSALLAVPAFPLIVNPTVLPNPL
jgi:hypothetical protein